MNFAYDRGFTKKVSKMPVSVFASVVFMVSASTGPQGQAPAAKGDDEMICKYQARTATRFKKKICYTKARWEEISENSKRQAAEDFNKPSISIEKGS